MNALRSLLPARRITVVAVLSLALLMGCSEKDDEIVTKTQLLSRVWQVQTAQYAYSNLTYIFYRKGGTANDTDLSPYRFTFNTDGTYRIKADSTSSAGNWELTEQDTKLSLDGQEDYTVVQLTEAQFDFSFTTQETDMNNKAVTVEYTYQLIPAN